MLYRSITTLMLAGLVCLGSNLLPAQAQETGDNSAEITTDEAAQGDSEADDAPESDAPEGDASKGEETEGEAGHAEDAEHDDGHTSGGHGEHDNDPTHANMKDGSLKVVSFAPGDIRTDMALFSGVVFLLLMAGLMRFAWKPIMTGLEKREERIAGDIQKAERDATAAATKLAEYNNQLSGAAEEAQQIVSAARKDAEATGQKLIDAAQEESARLQERATAEIESAKRVAMNDLASQSTSLAMQVAGRVVGREVNANDHDGLIQEMLAKLPSNN